MVDWQTIAYIVTPLALIVTIVLFIVELERNRKVLLREVR